MSLANRQWPPVPLNGATPEEQAAGEFRHFTIRRGLEAIAAAVADWAEPRGGVVELLENERHLWEKIYTAGDQPGCYVYWSGEAPRGSFSTQDMDHRVDRTFHVVLMRGHGFRALTPQEDGKPPATSFFTDDLEAVRDLVRALNGISEDFPVNYKGAYGLPGVAVPGQANVFLDCQDLRFGTANDIPMIAEDPSDIPD